MAKAKKRKPSVTVHCVADNYASPGERIVEFMFPNGKGGLISFRSRDDICTVELYRVDPGVAIVARGHVLEG